MRVAAAGRTPLDADLLAAIEEMLSDTEVFTPTLLGAGAPFSPAPDPGHNDVPEDALVAWLGVAPPGGDS